MTEESEESPFDIGDEKLKFSSLFEYIEPIGSGSFASVIAARDKVTKVEYAVKIIKKTLFDDTHLEFFRREANILAQLDHPNIIKLHKIVETENRIFLALERARGGQLRDLMNKRFQANNPFTEDEVATIMKAIFEGLGYIHSKDIIHRDLKPENILIADEEDLTTIRICDFGLAAQYVHDYAFAKRSFTDFCGTKMYMAPEVLEKRPYSKPIDIWSTGIIFYMLLSQGKHPFHVKGEKEEIFKAKAVNPTFEFTDKMSRWMRHLFMKLMNVDPLLRYTAAEAAQHPFITKQFHLEVQLTAQEKIKAMAKREAFIHMIKAMVILTKMNAFPEAVEQHYKENVEEMTRVHRPKSRQLKKKTIADSLRDIIGSLKTQRELSGGEDESQSLSPQISEIESEKVFMNDNRNHMYNHRSPLKPNTLQPPVQAPFRLLFLEKLEEHKKKALSTTLPDVNLSGGEDEKSPKTNQALNEVAKSNDRSTTASSKEDFVFPRKSNEEGLLRLQPADSDSKLREKLVINKQDSSMIGSLKLDNSFSNEHDISNVKQIEPLESSNFMKLPKPIARRPLLRLQNQKQRSSLTPIPASEKIDYSVLNETAPEENIKAKSISPARKMPSLSPIRDPKEKQDINFKKGPLTPVKIRKSSPKPLIKEITSDTPKILDSQKLPSIHDISFGQNKKILASIFAAQNPDLKPLPKKLERLELGPTKPARMYGSNILYQPKIMIFPMIGQKS